MTATRSASAFDLYAPLPSGTTVLEASAGTGKTYTIAALVTRFVAEGAAELDRMLIVTFSRAATGELRERVRERLTSAELGLADPAGARVDLGDPLLALLADAPDEEVDRRRRRLSRALTAFDAATIATTHQFCAQVLAGLGVTAELAALTGGDRFVESLDDLVTEVAEDLYLRKFATPGVADDAPIIPPKEAVAIAFEAVVREPQARLEPVAAPADSAAGVRRRLAEAVRQEVDRRKRLRGLRSYDDLQTDLAAVLRDPEQGPPAARRLRQRFPVVLIDEFQDTDPVQWDIVSQAFVGHVRLVLIGDPKQAVYGFRGADVTAYLKAVAQAREVATLERNWRSEPALLEAFDALFAEATFGDPAIAYRPVKAAREQSLLRAPADHAASPPMRLRLIAREPGMPLSGGGLVRVEALRPRVARDVASDIVGLLSSDTQITSPEAPSPGAGSPEFRPVQPGDVAVLVRTNAQATMVREALRDVGVPAVIGGASSVFTAPIARDWLILLEALEQPHRTGRVRAAAMTCFLASAARLALADPDETDALSGLLRSWAGVLATRGVAALQETIMSSQQLPARLLAEPDGERRLTDLRHIGESLHAAATADSLGITALVAWLRRRMDEADEATDGVEERSRRLDSDADAVQVVTIHRSKGLQFPVVYVPYGWDLFLPTVDRPRYHDPSGQRVLDVGCWSRGKRSRGFQRGGRPPSPRGGRRAVAAALCRGHPRPLAGRAVVGAEHHSGVRAAESAALRAVAGRFRAAAERSRTGRCRCPGAARCALERRGREDLGRGRRRAASDARWKGTPTARGELRTASFDRGLDLAWRRTSYSGLTAAAHDAGPGAGAAGAALSPAVGSEPEHGGLDDEPAADGVTRRGPLPAADDPAIAVTSPMALLPGGTAFGSLVHAVLETVDTTCAPLSDEISDRVAEQLSRWSPAASSTDRRRAARRRLAGGLRDATRPGREWPAAAGLSPADRLTELGSSCRCAVGSARAAPGTG